MGNKSSQTLKNYITNESIYNQTVNATLNLQNKTTMSTTNVNIAEIDNGGANGGANCCVIYDANGNPVKKDGVAQVLPGCTGTTATMNCNVIIDQNASSNQYAVQSIDSSFAQQLSTQLQNTAKADVSNALDQLQETDPTMFDNESKQDVENHINNVIDTTLTSNTTLNIVNSAVIASLNKNKAKLINCGTLTGEQCNFSQNASSKMVTHNILNSVANLAQSNKELNDFYTKVNNALTNKQEGIVGTLSGVLNSLFDSLGKVGLAIIIIVGLVILGGAILVVVLFIKGGGKEAVQGLTSNPQVQAALLQRLTGGGLQAATAV